MKKVILIIICSVLLISLLVINLSSSKPIFEIILMSEQLGKVYFNNHDIDETVRMGNDYLNKGNAKKAYIVYDYVLKIDPDNIKAYLGISDMYARLKNLNESKKWLKEAEKRINGETPSKEIIHIYYRAGLLYSGDFAYEGYKNIDTAIEYYTKGLNVQGLDEETVKLYHSVFHYKLGMLYSKKEMNELAIKHIEESIKLDSNNVDVYYTLGTLNIDEKKFEKAYENIMKYKDERGEDNSYFMYMGYYYTEKGEFDKVLNYLNKATENETIAYNYNFMYGNYYEKIGDVEKAKEYYTKAINSSLAAFRYIKNQRIIEKFNIDIEDIKRQNKEDRERNYNTFINI